MKELEIAIRSLKTRKCPGPDNIPNEIFTKSSKATRYIYLNVFNKRLRKREIPPQWLNRNITRLYKGKGSKGKCSNERGITLASNIGKYFERMVNNRATLMADMADAQAGGQKRQGHNGPPADPQRGNQCSQDTKTTSLRHVPGRHESIWQSMDRRHHVHDEQKRNKFPNMGNNKKAQWKPDCNYPNKIWTHKENPYQGQHTTRGGSCQYCNMPCLWMKSTRKYKEPTYESKSPTQTPG